MKTKSGIILATIALSVLSCSKPAPMTTVESSEVIKSQVRIMEVAESEVEQSMQFTATVEPEVKNNIAPQSPGRIRQIFVQVGDKVSKGQRLAQMDAISLSNSETQIQNLKRTYTRVAELYAVGGASQQDLDNAKLQLELAENNLKTLQENTYLISPISGVVSARNFDAGDMYNGQSPIMTVMQINPVKIRINVSESYFTKVKTGMPVEVKLDIYENEVFSGKVSLVYPTIDERTRTFGVEIKLQNNDSRVRPGMFARVSLNFGNMTRVVIPDQAIVKQSGSGARFVYVYNDGVVNYVQVEPGRRINDEFEILSGIQPGQKIVVSGQGKLNDGIEVDVIEE